MRKKYIFGKKLYISVLTSILVLLTTVATTFAWVGVFANSTFETFDITIKSSVLEEYSIQISLTGEEGSFSDSISFEDLYKQILLNCGYDEEVLTSKEKISNLYHTLDLDQCTTLPIISNNKIKSLGTFYDLWGFETHMYLKFDLYISCEKSYDSGDTSDFNLDVYLGDSMLNGSIKTHSLVNKYTYPTDFVNPLAFPNSQSNIVPLVGGDVITVARTNSASAARVGFEKYSVVKRGHPEQYNASSTPVSAMIYQTDSEYPYLNTDANAYSFGGILADEYNLATMYYNSTEWKYYASQGTIKSVSIPDDMYNARGVGSSTKDLVLSSTTNHLIDSQNEDEQIGIDDMMKVTVYFWFEGWDADCIPSINHSPVSINISLNMTNEVDF